MKKRPEPGPSELDQRNLKTGDIVQLRNREGEVIERGVVTVAMNDHYYIGSVGRAVKCTVQVGEEVREAWVYRHDRVPTRHLKEVKGAHEDRTIA